VQVLIRLLTLLMDYSKSPFRPGHNQGKPRSFGSPFHAIHRHGHPLPGFSYSYRSIISIIPRFTSVSVRVTCLIPLFLCPWELCLGNYSSHFPHVFCSFCKVEGLVLISLLQVFETLCLSCQPSNLAFSSCLYTTPVLLYSCTLHHTTLHYTTLHYTTLHYITLHYSSLHYTTLLLFTALHYYFLL